MRVEQEQRVTEDARRFAEQDAEAQRYAANVLQVIFFLIGASCSFYSVLKFVRVQVDSDLDMIELLRTDLAHTHSSSIFIFHHHPLPNDGNEDCNGMQRFASTG